MKRILSLGYGMVDGYEKVKSGDLSSRLYYGLMELHNKYMIKQLSLCSKGGFKGFLKKNLQALDVCDIVFMSYFYVSPLLFLSLLKTIGLLKRRLIVVSHHSLVLPSNVIKRAIYRMVYSAIDMFIFHSQRNLDESVAMNIIKKQKTDFVFWGENLNFIDNSFIISDLGFFISTGRENRDFAMLVEAFSQSSANLELYTNKHNCKNDYSFLDDLVNKYSNVKIEFVNKDLEVARIIGQRTAMSRCVVIPLLRQSVDYCVGLTSIVEAMAMGKPIISSPNPYSPINIEEAGIGFYAETLEEWRSAIEFINSNPRKAHEMGRKARVLAEKYYNIEVFANRLDFHFSR